MILWFRSSKSFRLSVRTAFGQTKVDVTVWIPSPTLCLFLGIGTSTKDSQSKFTDMHGIIGRDPQATIHALRHFVRETAEGVNLALRSRKVYCCRLLASTPADSKGAWLCKNTHEPCDATFQTKSWVWESHTKHRSIGSPG